MNKLLSIVVAAFGLVALLWRGNAYKAKAEQQEERAEQAETSSQTLQNINTAREVLGRKHTQENQDAEKDRATDSRNSLDNNW